jgi:hypothetical protein
MSPSGWLARAMPDVDWAFLRITSVVTNLVSLIFSVYMIRMLQYDKEIRSGFLPAEQK